jgi:phosphoglycolate phosphatase
VVHIFLDLDGTLVDPRQGITQSVRYALERMTLVAPPADELTWVIGPPLIESFTRLGVAAPEIALKYYRQRYAAQGIYEARVYDGVIAALTALTGAGHVLCLATAKPHVFARRVVAHFGLADHLADLFGPEMDGTRNDKADLLAHAIEITGAAPGASVMIGDRVHDIEAARANTMASVAVTWGFGDVGEWACADRICNAPPELPGILNDLLAT